MASREVSTVPDSECIHTTRNADSHSHTRAHTCMHTNTLACMASMKVSTLPNFRRTRTNASCRPGFCAHTPCGLVLSHECTDVHAHKHTHSKGKSYAGKRWGQATVRRQFASCRNAKSTAIVTSRPGVGGWPVSCSMTCTSCSTTAHSKIPRRAVLENTANFHIVQSFSTQHAFMCTPRHVNWIQPFAAVATANRPGVQVQE